MKEEREMNLVLQFPNKLSERKKLYNTLKPLVDLDLLLEVQLITIINRNETKKSLKK